MKTGEQLFSLLGAMVGVMIVALVVKSPNTSKVITAAGSAFSGAARAVMGN